MKYIIAASIFIVGISAAYAGGFMMLHVGSADGSGGVAPNGKILLVDGTSFILQTDAVSKICRAGGC